MKVVSGDAARWVGVSRVVLSGAGPREVESSRAYRDRLVLKLAGVDDARRTDRPGSWHGPGCRGCPGYDAFTGCPGYVAFTTRKQSEQYTGRSMRGLKGTWAWFPQREQTTAKYSRAGRSSRRS